MPTINALKGFEDVLPADAWKWQWIESVARETATLFHYDEIRTPVVENADLFHRGVGETSDMVRKETFTFAGKTDQGEAALLMTLRPEGTAGVVRAMIEHGFLNDQGARAKVFYIAPNFRYEKPQKGRVRQHHQFGAEAFGVADPRQDVECILLQMQFYKNTGLKDLQLQINSLGDAQSKQNYRNMLVEFLTPKKASLSENSQRRLEENPLRILDSKDPRDKEACVGAPGAFESLSDKSREHFLTVQKLLTEAEVPFVVNANLVRGFDYYTETLWEVTAGGLGSQNAVGGGGRYDNLVENLGGKPTPGVGFGSGIERLLIALEAQNALPPMPSRPLIWLAYHGPAAMNAQMKLMNKLRAEGYIVDMDLTGRAIKSQFKMANREKATVVAIAGDDELANGTVSLKNLDTGEQTTIPLDDLHLYLPKMRS